MTFLESLSFIYIVMATCGFTIVMGYMAFCGLRLYIDDARNGARYRVEDEEFRKITKGVQ